MSFSLLAKTSYGDFNAFFSHTFLIPNTPPSLYVEPMCGILYGMACVDIVKRRPLCFAGR